MSQRDELPQNLDAERFVLGSVLLDDSLFPQVAAILRAEDFSLEKHRRIFLRMGELNSRGEKIDHLTVAEELKRNNQLEACDGYGYLVSLDEGLPKIENIDSYIRVIKEKALRRRLIYLSHELSQTCASSEKDSAEILVDFSTRLLQIGSDGSRSGPASIAEIIDGHEGGLNYLLDPMARSRGLSTGYKRFDELTGGLHEGELIVLAGRPSMGKTALALNIAHHVAEKYKKAAVIFSLEMSKEALIERLVCASARVDSHRYRCGYLDAEERRKLQRAAAKLVELPICIDDTASASLADMRVSLRRTQAQCPVGIVVVDYLQLMTTREKVDNRVQAVSEISRGLKILARDLCVPVLALSQLSRAPELRVDRRPLLSDLRESGSIEQDADVVAFIFREEVYKQNDPALRGIAELIIAKQRNGPTGKIRLAFNHACTRFDDLTADSEENAA